MSNAYDSTRGNTTDRQRRKEWLLKTYAADVVLILTPYADAPIAIKSRNAHLWITEGDSLIECCRCYRCGKLLTLQTLTVDRIIPGCRGGTYRRTNIRPSCSDCANQTGGQLSAETRNQVPVVRPGVRKLAARDAQAGSAGAGTVSVPDVQASGPRGVRRNGALA